MSKFFDADSNIIQAGDVVYSILSPRTRKDIIKIEDGVIHLDDNPTEAIEFDQANFLDTNWRKVSSHVEDAKGHPVNVGDTLYHTQMKKVEKKVFAIYPQSVVIKDIAPMAMESESYTIAEFCKSQWRKKVE